MGRDKILLLSFLLVVDASHPHLLSLKWNCEDDSIMQIFSQLEISERLPISHVHIRIGCWMCVWKKFSSKQIILAVEKWMENNFHHFYLFSAGFFWKNVNWRFRSHSVLALFKRWKKLSQWSYRILSRLFSLLLLLQTVFFISFKVVFRHSKVVICKKKICVSSPHPLVLARVFHKNITKSRRKSWVKNHKREIRATMLCAFSLTRIQSTRDFRDRTLASSLLARTMSASRLCAP